VREPRSIIFYAWAGLAVQAALVAGVIAFVLAGAAYQRSAITDLHQKVQVLSVANLTLQVDFIAAQSAIGAYQTTGQIRFLNTYRAEQGEFATAQARVQQLASGRLLAAAAMQMRAGWSAFGAYDSAAALPLRSASADRLYARAGTLSDVFFSQNDRFRQFLAADSNALTSKSERILGVGLGWTVAVLALGLMVPVLAVAVGLRWVNGPLHAVTSAIRRRAHGDTRARAVPGGPADVRELALSLNFLADENDRVRVAEQERAHLLAEVRLAAVRIRKHLHGQAVIREAVTAIQEHLAVDFVWVGLVSGERLTIGEGDEEAWRQVGDVVGYLPPGSVAWLQEIYQHRSSYRIQDPRADEAAEIPEQIREVLLGLGASSLLLTPFGIGPELLGCLTVSRDDPRRPWTAAEAEAVESLAGDIGRGLEHARLYEGEERVIEELKAVDRAKAGFIAAASHDLRTPLTSIIGYAELLADGEAGLVTPEQVKMVDAVDRNAKRLKTLVEDVLTVSKIELGAFTSRLQPVDLAGLVWASAEVIRPSAGVGGLTFEMLSPHEGVMVDGDAEQLDRVLVNLLSNAVKYTPRGGDVSLSLVREKDSAVLTVSDSGIGIPEKDQSSLFTRFFRASNAVERALPGSGLGLSIVRTIVVNHHGDISFASAEGRGTTFTVRLPLRPESRAQGRNGRSAARAR
jgi:two-component system phosphate regulon sensor histidine kinase PhoR